MNVPKELEENSERLFSHGCECNVMRRFRVEVNLFSSMASSFEAALRASSG